MTNNLKDQRCSRYQTEPILPLAKGLLFFPSISLHRQDLQHVWQEAEAPVVTWDATATDPVGPGRLYAAASLNLVAVHEDATAAVGRRRAPAAAQSRHREVGGFRVEGERDAAGGPRRPATEELRQGRWLLVHELRGRGRVEAAEKTHRRTVLCTLPRLYLSSCLDLFLIDSILGF